MMMNLRLISFATVLQAVVVFLVAVTQVQARPLSIERRKDLTVFNPTILEPTGSTVWEKGAEEPVSWDTRNAPESISNNGHVYLKTVPADSKTQPKLTHLAGPFDLRDGHVTVTVPDNAVTGQYKIILFGDSGNDSEEFHVNGVEPSGNTGSQTPSATPQASTSA